MCFCHRDSGESGQDTVGLSMSMSELDDSGDGKTKKKRGRPGRPPVRLLQILLTWLTTVGGLIPLLLLFQFGVSILPPGSQQETQEVTIGKGSDGGGTWT